jgi:hypothetical protein
MGGRTGGGGGRGGRGGNRCRRVDGVGEYGGRRGGGGGRRGGGGRNRGRRVDGVRECRGEYKSKKTKEVMKRQNKDKFKREKKKFKEKRIGKNGKAAIKLGYSTCEDTVRIENNKYYL